MSVRSSMRKVSKALTRPFVLFTILAAVVALFFWFIAPLIAIGEFRPFGSIVVRLWISVLIALAWGIGNVVAQRRRDRAEQALLDSLRQREEEANAAAEQAEERIRKEVAGIKARLDRALALLRRGRGVVGRFNVANQLPWYLLIGPKGAGKTTAVMNAGLILPDPDIADASAQTTSCNVIISDRAIFLDAAGRYTTQDSDPAFDGAVWVRMLDLIRRRRPRHPLSGILLFVSATDLANLEPEQRHALALTVRRRLDEIGARLKARIPVYVVLSKLDLVAGFEESFETLSTEESTQIWGIPLASLAEPMTASAEQFSVRFDELERRLARRQMPRLQDETSERRRALIFEFPTQVATMLDALENFFEVVSGTHQFAVTPFLRGIFLTSAKQSGQRVDLIGEPLAHTFALNEAGWRVADTSRPTRGRSFFLKRFIQDVVIAESGISGWSPPALFRARMRWLAASVAVAVLFVGALVYGWISYRDGSIYVTRVLAATEQAQQRLNSYLPQPRVLPPFPQTLAVLNDLRAIDAPRSDLSPGRVYRVGAIESSAEAAYKRGLIDLLLPYVMANLETGMTSPAMPNPARFKQLKLYLTLGGEHPLEPSLTEDLMPFFSVTLLPKDEGAQAREMLRAHLTALAQASPPAQNLDEAKVRRARQFIADATLAKVAYDIVRDEVASRNLPLWGLVDHMGSAGPRALALASEASLWTGVSSLYTKTGFRSILPPVAAQVAEQLARDVWVLGPVGSRLPQSEQADRIRAGILDLYRADYIRVWDSLLSDLTVVPLHTPAQSAEVLAILIGPNSPLKQILDAVASETNLDRSIPGGAAGQGVAQGLGQSVSSWFGGLAPDVSVPTPPSDPVTVHFASLRNAVRAPQGKESQVDSVLKVVEALYRQLNHLATGGDILELGSEPQTILNQAGTLIAGLPPSLQPVFTRIRKEALGVAASQSHDRLKSIWSATVLPFCQSVTVGKFPFDPASARDAPVGDFAKLFGPDGVLASYRKMYLKPFVDTTVKPWRWRSGRNIDVQFDAETLTQFERADRISGAFFAQGDKPLTRFSVEFTRLHASATAAQLDGGGAILSYAHGPSAPVPAQWPSPTETAPAILSVTPELEGKTNIVTGEGPWSMFRLMQKGKISTQGPVVTAGFDLGGRALTIQVKSTALQNPFEPGLLSAFRCPSM